MNVLIEEIEAIAERVFERKFAESKHARSAVVGETPAALALRDRLARINSKVYISFGEAALLLNCSDGHMRNLVGRARKRQTKNPIPFSDLDGVVVFNRVTLLAWAGTPKHKLEVIRVEEKISNG